MSVHNYYTSSALLKYVYKQGYYILGTGFTMFKGVRILSIYIFKITCSSP